MMDEWVKRALAHSGMSQSEFARRLAADRGWPLDRSIINKILNGRREVSAKELLDISAIADFPLPVTESTSSKNNDLPNATLVGKVKGGPIKVPVYGQAVGGEDGEFWMNGNVLFDVLAPPVISEIKNAYAIAVSGSSMSPRYEEGEICFIDPTRRVKAGDYVVAQIKVNDHDPPLAYIKRLVRWTTTELVLEQFNPPKQITFPHAQVHTVHFVAMAGVA